MNEKPEAPSPAIGVGGLVFDPMGRVLLVLRKNPPKAGLWHIPGGKLEPGETLQECCTREVFEETGLIVSPREIIAIADRNLEGFHYVIIDFLAELDGEFPKTSAQSGSDATRAEWISPEDLPGFQIVEGLAEVIVAGQKIRARERSGLLNPSPLQRWLYT